MLKLIFTDFPAGRNGLALLFLRLFVGVAFVLHWMGAAAMLTQLFGGIFLIIGLLTPFAALGVAGTVAVAAVFLIQKGEPFINPVGHSWENAAFYTVAGIFLAVSGAGAYSLDAAIFGRKADGVQTNAASAQPTISYN
jgi:putative oxidoreductase